MNDREPTPFEREIDEVSRFNLASVLQPQVELVLTDDVEIFARCTVSASEADWEIERLNAATKGATWRTVVWRRARTYREPLDMLCGLCGTKHCGCTHASGETGVRAHDRGDR